MGHSATIGHFRAVHGVDRCCCQVDRGAPDCYSAGAPRTELTLVKHIGVLRHCVPLGRQSTGQPGFNRASVARRSLRSVAAVDPSQGTTRAIQGGNRTGLPGRRYIGKQESLRVRVDGSDADTLQAFGQLQECRRGISELGGWWNFPSMYQAIAHVTKPIEFIGLLFARQ